MRAHSADRYGRGGGVRGACRRGSAMVMMVILSVVLTALVIAISVSGGNGAQMSGAVVRLNQAYGAAESGGQIAVWQFKHDNQWKQATAPVTLPTLSVGNNTFSYSVTSSESGTTPTMYWPLSEGSGVTTADASGNSNTGTLVGGVTWTTQGKYGNGLLFDGATGYIDCGNKASMNIAGSITLAAWIKLNSAAQDQKIIGNEDGSASNYNNGYKMALFGQKVELELGTVARSNRFIAGGTLLQVGVWYHIASTYDASTGTLRSYVNGVADRTQTGLGSQALVASTVGVTIGRETWASGGNMRYFNGTMDEVRVYNRALSAQELMSLAVPTMRVHSVSGLTTGAGGTSAGVDFSVSAPPPLPPTAPSVAVGGSLGMKYLTASGDVQAGNVTVNGGSTINGHLNYKTTFTDPSHYLTLTYRGDVISPVQDGTVTVPTLNYANIAGLAVATTPGSTNQSIVFHHVNNGVNVQAITGNCTDPVIDTTETGGTLYISGNLTITKNTTWATPGNPVFIVVKGNVIQSGTLNLSGALYAGGNWSHADASIGGLVCVGGSVTDNSTTQTTIMGGGIPWFDPRGAAPSITVPMYYTNYQGALP